ncbi:hypothetical protein M6D93_07285 [Jatrophihabitans telluris]|uniref:Uncharacterized protein n=1 Tax=Jatrophihabitans telluris TaxID=2038343 RepID=A0ABY4R2U2_9ACTN|nr:hypothetical protein [Jatrophihabitans telluris]UQX89797.1 hypothetical protein M6D93_07285 [Jatrophihabitans telluris]
MNQLQTGRRGARFLAATEGIEEIADPVLQKLSRSYVRDGGQYWRCGGLL